MTKQLSAARSILALSKEEDSWNYIKEETDVFIWTDDDTIEQWNNIASETKLPRVDQRIDSSAKDEREFLTYKGKTVEVPLSQSTDDRLITVHTLGRLVRNDSDIRFCLDSWHSSNLAFLALSGADWKALEKEFGKKAVAFRFLAFPKSLENFFKQAFSEENNREYASDVPGTSAEEQAVKEFAGYIRIEARVLCPSAEVVCMFDPLVSRDFGFIIKTKTDADLDKLRRRFGESFLDWVRKFCAEQALVLTHAIIQSQESVNRGVSGDWSVGGSDYFMYRRSDASSNF